MIDYILDRYFAEKLLDKLMDFITGCYVYDLKKRYKQGHITLWAKKRTDNDKQYKLVFGCATKDVLVYWFNLSDTFDSVFQNLKEVMR